MDARIHPELERIVWLEIFIILLVCGEAGNGDVRMCVCMRVRSVRSGMHLSDACLRFASTKLLN